MGVALISVLFRTKGLAAYHSDEIPLTSGEDPRKHVHAIGRFSTKDALSI